MLIFQYRSCEIQLNFPTIYIWSDVSPHNTMQSRYEQQFSINDAVFARKKGPYAIPVTNGNKL
jgi:hypothetical protein